MERRKYMAIRLDECSDCAGSGVVNGSECCLCAGTGYVRDEVPLAEALRSLGVEGKQR